MQLCQINNTNKLEHHYPKALLAVKQAKLRHSTGVKYKKKKESESQSNSSQEVLKKLNI